MFDLKLPAYGKINISLDILNLRSDGYHELASVMQSIELADWLSFQLNQTGEINLSSNSTELSLGEDNLIIKAAKLLQQEFSPKQGIDIYLEKNLPLAAGLGGGSSDGALTLNALNFLWGLGLTGSQLITLGATLGADIPFKIIGGTALAQGIGEKLTILTPGPKLPLLLVKPELSLGAGEVYQAWDKGAGVSNQATINVLTALEQNDINKFISAMGNDLQPIVIELAPQVGEIIAEMEALGVLKAIVSGSGPTVIGVIKDRQQGQHLEEHFRKSYQEVYLTSTV